MGTKDSRYKRGQSSPRWGESTIHKGLEVKSGVKRVKECWTTCEGSARLTKEMKFEEKQ